MNDAAQSRALKTRFGAALRVLQDELRPTPSRLRESFALTAVTVVTAFAGLMMGIPETALSCFILFAVWRSDAGSQIAMLLPVIIALTLALALLVWILNHTIDNQMMRLAVILAFTVAGMFLAEASKLGKGGSIVGFIYAFGMTLPDIVPSAELLSQMVKWIWIVVILPFAVLFLWGILAGRSARRCLEDRIAARLAACDSPHGSVATDLLDEGLSRDDQLLLFAKFGDLTEDEAADLARRADESYYHLARRRAGAPLEPTSGAAPSEAEPLLKPDAFSNPRYIQFALKVALAAALTYCFYTAFGGFAIHTAMITCYFVALGSQGKTYHKSTLRVAGCLIGAAAGMIVILGIMPYMTDIGQLMIVLAVGTFCAAYVTSGSERISYAGWQIALCFFLMVLHGSGPTSSLDSGIYRILGILVGVFVVWMVFKAVWPVSAVADARAALERFEAEAAVASPPASNRPTNGRGAARLRAPLAEARRFAEASDFEQQSADVFGAIDAAEARYDQIISGGGPRG